MKLNEMATEGDTWRPAVGRSTDDGPSVRRDPTEEATSVSAPVHSSERGEALRVLRNKIEAAVWVLSACGVGYYGDGDSHMLKVALLDAAVKRDWLYFGFGMVGVNVAIFLYLAVWLNTLKGNTGEWEDVAPLAAPIGTFAGLLAGFSFMVALWPVWSFLTPVLLFVLFMGFIMSAHFWPSFGGTRHPSRSSTTPRKDVDRDSKTL